MNLQTCCQATRPQEQTLLCLNQHQARQTRRNLALSSRKNLSVSDHAKVSLRRPIMASNSNVGMLGPAAGQQLLCPVPMPKIQIKTYVIRHSGPMIHTTHATPQLRVSISNPNVPFPGEHSHKHSVYGSGGQASHVRSEYMLGAGREGESELKSQGHICSSFDIDRELIEDVIEAEFHRDLQQVMRSEGQLNELTAHEQYSQSRAKQDNLSQQHSSHFLKPAPILDCTSSRISGVHSGPRNLDDIICTRTESVGSDSSSSHYSQVIHSPKLYNRPKEPTSQLTRSQLPIGNPGRQLRHSRSLSDA